MDASCKELALVTRIATTIQREVLKAPPLSGFGETGKKVAICHTKRIRQEDSV